MFWYEWFWKSQFFTHSKSPLSRSVKSYFFFYFVYLIVTEKEENPERAEKYIFSLWLVSYESTTATRREKNIIRTSREFYFYWRVAVKCYSRLEVSIIMKHKVVVLNGAFKNNFISFSFFLFFFACSLLPESSLPRVSLQKYWTCAIFHFIRAHLRESCRVIYLLFLSCPLYNPSFPLFLLCACSRHERALTGVRALFLSALLR